MRLTDKTKRILPFIFLLCFAFQLQASGQVGEFSKELEQAQTEFDQGNFPKAGELAGKTVRQARKIRSHLLAAEAADVLAASLIIAQKYEAAENLLRESLIKLGTREAENYLKARLNLRLAGIRRVQRKYSEAFDYGKKALAFAPDAGQIRGEYFLNIGRILFSSGFDVSAVVWLEKAAQALEKEKSSSAKLETFRFLSLAWASKLNYKTALLYSDRLISAAAGTRFGYQYRQALLDAATFLSARGQYRKAQLALEKGLQMSKGQKNPYQTRLFLSSLLLTALDKYNVVAAGVYLTQLDNYDTENQFAFERSLGKAIIAAFSGQPDEAEKYFSEAEKAQQFSEFTLPRWKIRVAEKNKEWKKVLELNRKVLELTLQDILQTVINEDLSKV